VTWTWYSWALEAEERNEVMRGRKGEKQRERGVEAPSFSHRGNGGGTATCHEWATDEDDGNREEKGQ
jgi:hypothetical protein